MKDFRGVLHIALCACIFAPSFAHSGQNIFEGEIADSSCAMNVHSLTHSHQEMLKNQGKYMGHDARSCSQYCVRKMGSEYVLSNNNEVYHLDDQSKAAAFAGEKVSVTGTLDESTKTIHVESIERKK